MGYDDPLTYELVIGSVGGGQAQRSSAGPAGVRGAGPGPALRARRQRDQRAQRRAAADRQDLAQYTCTQDVRSTRVKIEEGIERLCMVQLDWYCENAPDI